MKNNALGRNVRRVLVVEDDLALTTILDRVFAAIDPMIQVDWVVSAEQAILRLKQQIDQSPDHPYDLILADVFLDGERSGLDLYRICQEQFPEVPIVVTSALPADKFLAAVGPDSVAPTFLAKPFRVGECHQLLEGMLHYSRGGP